VNRLQLEHIIRAAGDIAEDDEIVILGSTRLIPMHNENTRGITGWGVEIPDWILGKYVSGREKGLGFNKEVIARRLVSGEILQERVKHLGA